MKEAEVVITDVSGSENGRMLFYTLDVEVGSLDIGMINYASLFVDGFGGCFLFGDCDSEDFWRPSMPRHSGRH